MDEDAGSADEIMPLEEAAQRAAEAETKRELGNNAYKSGDYLTAVKFYSEAIKLCPEEATYYSNRSAAQLMLKGYEGAIEDCNKAVDLNPSLHKVSLRGAKIHTTLGEYEEAIKFLLRILVVDPRHDEALAERQAITKLQEASNECKKCLEMKQYDRALSLAEKILQKSPESIPTRTVKAKALLALRKFQDVISLAGTLLGYDGKNPELLFLRGRAFLSQGELEKALKHFQEAMRVDPDNALCRQEFKRVRAMQDLKKAGNDHFAAGRSEQAIQSYTECLELDPGNEPFESTIFCNRAAALMRLKRFTEAVKDCDAALERNKEYTKAMSRKAACLGEMEEWEECVRVWEAVCKLDDSHENKQNLSNAKLELKKSKRKDYYKLIGVSRDATETEIKKAYRKAALQWHPDKNTESEQVRLHAEKMFKDINEGYAILSDPQKRRRYDAGADVDEIENGGGGGFGAGGMDPDILFQMFGGGMGGGFGGGFGGFGGGFGGGGGGGGGHRHFRRGGH